MLFCNNHVVLHDRTKFIDHLDEIKARHLYRLWIATPLARELPPVFAERYGSVTIGDRGGVNVSGVKSIATLTAAELVP
jgi:hypothetical protein